jgi:parallel beta-helix repeat protein
MADPITWYLLPRKVDDPTTIEEYIQQKILEHNLDPSAHGQADEAIFQHRMAEVIDHVNYSIYNIKLFPQQRPIKAFVDAGGAGEFTEMQPALDYVHLLGGGKIFVKAGTYYLNNDVTLYSDIELEGEDNDTTIFDFQNTQKQFKLIGTSSAHKRNFWMRNIQIRNSRKGGLGALRLEYVDDFGIENCKFTNNKQSGGSYGAAISLYNCTRGTIENNYSYDDQIAVDASDCTHIKIKGNQIQSANTAAIRVMAGTSNFIFNNLITSSANAAIYLDAANKTQVIGNFISNFTSYGITTGEDNPSSYLIIANNYIENGGTSSAAIAFYYGSSYCVITGNNLYYNRGEGIYFISVVRNTIIGNSITAGGRGIYLDADTDRNIVVANILRGNTTAITNQGTNNIIANNIT